MISELTAKTSTFFQESSLPPKAFFAASLPDIATPLSAKILKSELEKSNNLPLYQQENLRCIALDQATRLINKGNHNQLAQELVQLIFAKPVHENIQDGFHFPFLQAKMENGYPKSSLFQPLTVGKQGESWHHWTPIYQMVEFCLNHKDLAKTGQLLINDAIKTREKLEKGQKEAFTDFFIYAFHFYVDQGHLQTQNGPLWAQAFMETAKSKPDSTKLLNSIRILTEMINPHEKYHSGVGQMADAFLSQLKEKSEVEEKTKFWLATAALGLPQSNDFFNSLDPQHFIELITKHDVPKDNDNHAFHFWRRFRIIQKSRPDLTRIFEEKVLTPLLTDPKLKSIYLQELTAVKL